MRTPLKKLIPYSMGRRMRGLWQKSQSLYYRGNNYHCPFCDNNFRKLLPGGFDLPVIKEKQIIGGGRRNNNICPRCYSTDRDRLIYLYLKNYTSIFEKDIKLFHVAPSGALKALLTSQPNIDYTMGTKHHEGFYYARNIDLLDITKLNIQDNTFDVILCNHVLEHIHNDIKAMSELRRVLKPGGWAILQVPMSKLLKQTYEDPSITSEKEREKHFGQFDHLRIYGSDYNQRLEQVGFRVEVQNPYNDHWNIENLDKFALNKEESIYVVYK